ncbi:MAG: histidine kinase [Saprospiraceae bacterium]|nr:histidine kinase [Saprospiraceae bacterium]
MRKACILYVDDEPENLFSFQAAFRRFFDVLTAENAEDAINLLEKEPIAVLLCDQRMPGITGAELLALAKDRWPKVVRILVTGYSDMSVVVEAINKGNTYYYVTKPWNTEELRLILQNAKAKWQLETEYEALVVEKHLIEKKALEAEKAAIEARWSALHGKLQPHFLFNALNTIPQLIRAHPEQATAFTLALARLLRRLIEQPETLTNLLAEEVAIAKDYLMLQGIRFEDKLQVEWVLPDELPALFIPRLSLQLVIENALKHNEISREYPLHVRIEINHEAGILTVSNRHQPREIAEEGLGIGLSNIRNRYAMLGDKQVTTTLVNHNFSVTLPLLPKAAHE